MPGYEDRKSVRIIPDWIKLYVPHEKWHEYRLFAEESELTPQILKEWYEAGRPTVPRGFGVYLCVAVKPESFHRYAKDVVRITFGDGFTDHLRLAQTGFLGFSEMEWGLYMSPRSAFGGLTHTEMTELPSTSGEQKLSPPENTPEPITVTTNSAGGEQRRCESCGQSLTVQRQGARYCNATCRKRAWRAEKRESVAPAEAVR